MSPPLNLLIPMAGQGKRFRRAGYETYKPFVPIFGKPMIRWVLDAFPPEVMRRVLADRSLLTDDELDYLERQPGVQVHFVPSHGLGPAYTIQQARAELPLDEAFFIAYCDIYWTWDWEEVESSLDADGIVFTRRRFHPHLVGNNYSAFCRPAPDDEYRLQEIREKGSFTDEWMEEPLSIGTFYVRDGRAMMAAIDAMIAEDRRVSDEFFPSLLFNDLVEAGRTIRMQDVDFFVHWGVPQQLDDVLSWVRTCRRLEEPTPGSDAENVCCMGGAGARMKELAVLPKPLIPLADGEPMYRYVARRFGCRSNTFIVNEELAEHLEARVREGEAVLDIGPPTTSQVATLEKARDFLEGRANFFLTSCDALGLWESGEFDAYLERHDPDAVIFTFEPSLLQEALDGSHTYVRTSGPWIESIHIKHRPDGEARGLAGFFWFERGDVFGELDRVPEDPGRELSADHVLKYMLKQGKRIGAFPLDSYLHLGSPDELQEFAFWKRYHSLFSPADHG